MVIYHFPVQTCTNAHSLYSMALGYYCASTVVQWKAKYHTNFDVRFQFSVSVQAFSRALDVEAMEIFFFFKCILFFVSFTNKRVSQYTFQYLSSFLVEFGRIGGLFTVICLIINYIVMVKMKIYLVDQVLMDGFGHRFQVKVVFIAGRQSSLPTSFQNRTFICATSRD